MRRTSMRRMQHALRVDTIDPTRGFVDMSESEGIIANAGNLSIQECEGELRQLSGEIAKANNELLAAKGARNKEAIDHIGRIIATLCARRSPFKRRIIELRQRDQSQILGDAIRAIAPPEMQQAIFAEAQRIQSEISGQEP